MASKIDSIIDITITRQTKGLTAAGFGVPLILGESMKLDRRYKTYANITEVGDDFATTDVEYMMASTMFSQQISPNTISIGKKVVVASTAITQATNPSGDIVNIELVGIGISAEVGAGITVSGYTTAEYNGTFVITDIIDDDNIRYTAASTPSASPAVGSGALVLLEEWDVALQNVFDFNSTWYFVNITSNVKADIKLIAAKTEVLERLFLARTSDLDNLDSAITTSLTAELKALNYDRTLSIFNGDTVTQFAEAAWEARLAPTDPGSNNWAYKTLIGVVTDDLKSSESSSLIETGGNNANSYETIAGVDITRYGKVASGEFIDIIRGSDWLKARMQERILLELVNVEKIPFSEQGIGIAENLIREILDLGVTNGFIRALADGTGEYTITSPALEDIPTQDKIDRLLPDIEFDAKLAGAINKVSIRGVLSV